MGHASMLLYSLLHLTEVRAGNPKYERLREAAVTLGDIERFASSTASAIGDLLEIDLRVLLAASRSAA
jgi:transketolase